MSNETPSRNLPALARQTGGALVEVLGWPQYQGLPTNLQTAIAMTVAQDVQKLNTEHAVDLLADAASFHGEALNRWFSDLIAEHGVDRVHLSIEYLWDLGLRGGHVVTLPARETFEDKLYATPRLNAAEQIEESIALLATMEEAGIDVEDRTPGCEAIITVGGWRQACRLSAAEFSDAIRDEDGAKQGEEQVEPPSYSLLGDMPEEYSDMDDELLQELTQQLRETLATSFSRLAKLAGMPDTELAGRLGIPVAGNEAMIDSLPLSRLRKLDMPLGMMAQVAQLPTDVISKAVAQEAWVE